MRDFNSLKAAVGRDAHPGLAHRLNKQIVPGELIPSNAHDVPVSRAPTKNAPAGFHIIAPPQSERRQDTTSLELTLAHSGAIVDDKGGDILFVSHG